MANDGFNSIEPSRLEDELLPINNQIYYGAIIDGRTPTITSFVKATHDHSTNTKGGLLGASAMPNLSLSTQAISNPYKFRAYRTADVSNSDNTSYDIVFNAEEFDTNNNFNTTTGQYTIPVTGYYQINANARINGTTGTGWLWQATLILFKDSTSVDDEQIYVYDQGRFTFITLHIGGLYYFTAGQVLKVRAYADVNTVTNWVLTGGTAVTNFSGFLVSQT